MEATRLRVIRAGPRLLVHLRTVEAGGVERHSHGIALEPQDLRSACATAARF